MVTPPKVFISATSGDLRSIRQIVKEALLTINCHPIEQTNSEPDARTAADFLRAKIEDCQALIHIVGLRYGLEPDPAKLPPGAPRRSYTQLEYDIARDIQQKRGDKKFRLYTFVCPATFPYDEGADPEAEEKMNLQLAHRARLLEDPHLFHQPADRAEFTTRIHTLQEVIHTLRAEADRRHRSVILAAAAILVALCGIAWAIVSLTKKTGELASGQKQITESIERDKLTDRALASYQERFRHHREQDKDLPNKTIDAMVRAELPGILKAEPVTVKAILEQEAPKLAVALDTPTSKKLSALFVMGNYETVIAEGEKKIAQPAITSLQTMGDAARALFDKDPGKKHLETALRYYTGAAALVEKDKAPIEWANIQHSAAMVLDDLARYKEAEPLKREVAAIFKRELGEKSATYAGALNNLAQTLQATNRPAEAEPLMRSALAIDEATFGANDPNVARDLNNLAGLLKSTNRSAEAETMMRRALAIDEAAFGGKHPKVAIHLSNLAGLLYAEGRHAEAEPMYRRALAIDEASFSDTHPTVALRLNNLAVLLQSTRRQAEAEPLLRRAVEVCEKSLGDKHPKVAAALNNLAALLKTTGRLAEAEPMYRRALAIDEASLGGNHLTVALRLNNLAALLQAADRKPEAEPLMRRAISIKEAASGNDSPTLARDLHNLAHMLNSTNRSEEAEPLYRRALAIFSKAYGDRYPAVSRILDDLATLLNNAGRSAEAVPFARRSLVIEEARHGANHEDVATSLNNLAGLLQANDKIAEAEPLFRRALAIYEAKPGGSTRDVATALNNLAALLQATNRRTEAEPLVSRAVGIYEKSLGANNPTTISAREFLEELRKEMRDGAK